MNERDEILVKEEHTFNNLNIIPTVTPGRCKSKLDVEFERWCNRNCPKPMTMEALNSIEISSSDECVGHGMYDSHLSLTAVIPIAYRENMRDNGQGGVTVDFVVAKGRRELPKILLMELVDLAKKGLTNDGQ